MEWKLLRDVPAEDVRELLAIARRRTFDRGEVVFHEHDPADSLHLVTKGRFTVENRTPLGDTAVVAVCGAGDAFGELALVSDDGSRSATVTALEPAETRAVHRHDFERLRRANPHVNEVLVALLAAQVRRLGTHLVEAYYVDADRRVRRRLLELVELYGPATETVVPLTQEQLAAVAGTSRATVNRILREEEQRGSVRLERGRTVVLDRDALARRAR